MISTNCGMPGDLTDEASWFLTSLPLSQLCRPDCKEAIYHQFIIKETFINKDVSRKVTIQYTNVISKSKGKFLTNRGNYFLH